MIEGRGSSMSHFNSDIVPGSVWEYFGGFECEGNVGESGVVTECGAVGDCVQ